MALEWIIPVFSGVQLVITGLLGVLWKGHNDIHKTEASRVVVLEGKAFALEAETSYLRGYVERFKEEREETKGKLNYLTQRVDTMADRMMTKDDLDRLLKALVTTK